MWMDNEVEIYFPKLDFLDSIWPNLNTQDDASLNVINFWGPLSGVPFFACRKREMLHVDG